MRRKWVTIDEALNEQVWCDIHGCVHDRSRNPYDAAEPECCPEHWLKVRTQVWANEEEWEKP